MPKTESFVKAFLTGDKTAFKTLYTETSEMLYRVVFRMTGSREEAEDILHDVYIKAYEKRKSYKPELSGLRTWLYRIAVNHTLNVLKRRNWNNNMRRFLGWQEAERDVLDDCVTAEEGQDMQRLLQKVPENFRVCLVLRDIEEKPYEEIAGLLKLNTGTVKSRINRGRKMLKELYEREGG